MNIKSEERQIAWITGMPRSGTTWLSQIFASSPDVRLKFCPLFSYEFKNALDESSSAEQWDKLYLELYQTNSEFLDQDHLRKHGLIPSFTDKNESPRHLIIKSNRFHNLAPHIMKLNDHVRFIHIVRHPCATIYSWLSNPHEFPKNAEILKEWRSGNCRKTGPGEFWGYDDWKQVTTQALRLSEQYSARFKIIRYENLVRNTEDHIRELHKFLHISFSKQTQDFIELTRSRHDDRKNSVFKDPGLKDKWEEMLDPVIISECLSEVKNTELDQFVKD